MIRMDLTEFHCLIAHSANRCGELRTHRVAYFHFSSTLLAIRSDAVCYASDMNGSRSYTVLCICVYACCPNVCRLSIVLIQRLAQLESTSFELIHESDGN